MQQTAYHHSRTDAFAHPRHNVGGLGIQPGMAVADFGSGSGEYVLGIAHELEGSGHVYAIDVQRDLLRRTMNEAGKRGYKNVGIIWGDLEKQGGSKIANRHLDLVLISNLLFQIEEKSIVLQEARRILKPTGHLAIIDWRDSYRGMGPLKDDVITKEKAKDLASSAGFDLVREFPAGAHHYGLIFRLAPRTS